MINGVLVTPLNIISTPGGNVMHAIKKEDAGFNGFEEVYFSNIIFGAIKGWKQHKEMTMNLIVPVGEVRFVLFDEANGIFQQINLSLKNYCRLTVPPMIWMAFEGVGKNSILANIANIAHNPSEINRKELVNINFNWKG